MLTPSIIIYFVCYRIDFRILFLLWLDQMGKYTDKDHLLKDKLQLVFYKL